MPKLEGIKNFRNPKGLVVSTSTQWPGSPGFASAQPESGNKKFNFHFSFEDLIWVLHISWFKLREQFDHINAHKVNLHGREKKHLWIWLSPRKPIVLFFLTISICILIFCFLKTMFFLLLQTFSLFYHIFWLLQVKSKKH